MSAFRPAQAQRWNLYAGFAQAMDNPGARAELRGWCGLGLLSLAIAGVFAFLLVLARVPHSDSLFPWPVAFFQKGLVIHVIFSFVVWFLSIFGALLSVAAHRIGDGAPAGAWAGRLALWAGYASCPLLFIPALLDGGEPSLNNYVPVIIDPVYYAGLGVLAAGLLVASLRIVVLVPNRSGPLEPVGQAALAGAMLYILSLVCFAAAWTALAGDPLDGAFNESLFWGGGHILQFLNVAMMLAGWYVLGGLALERPAMRPQLMTVSYVLLIAAALMGPLFYALFDPFSADQTMAFTNLQYLLAPPSLLAAAAIVRTIAGHAGAGPLPRQDAGFRCIWLSMVVFGTGGVLGLFVDGADARTPAHYHGMIGAATLVFMGLMVQFFLPLTNRALDMGRRIGVFIYLYAVGQILFCIGLYVAGGHGAARKTAGGAESMEALAAQIGLYVYGVGSLMTVIGGIMFIWIAGRAVLRRID